MTSVGNSATILLVDDDEAVRHFVRRILQQHGFQVIEASDGAEALMISASRYSDVSSVEFSLARISARLFTACWMTSQASSSRSASARSGACARRTINIVLGWLRVRIERRENPERRRHKRIHCDFSGDPTCHLHDSK
jgi:hypothetical protein